MPRLMLNDELWSKLRTIMLQNGIYDKPNLPIMVEGILYHIRLGCPWRDLPAKFGCWNTIYQKFNRWPSKNKIMDVFKAMILEPDRENEAIGKSKGGNTIKFIWQLIQMTFPFILK